MNIFFQIFTWLLAADRTDFEGTNVSVSRKYWFWRPPVPFRSPAEINDILYMRSQISTTCVPSWCPRNDKSVCANEVRYGKCSLAHHTIDVARVSVSTAVTINDTNEVQCLEKCKTVGTGTVRVRWWPEFGGATNSGWSDERRKTTTNDNQGERM